MKDLIQEITKQLDGLKEKIPLIEDLRSLLEERTVYLGRKSKLSSALRQVGELSSEIRDQAGKEINELKKVFEEVFAEHEEHLKTKSSETQEIKGVGLPGYPYRIGKAHPIYQVRDRILDYFNRLGFITLHGWEMESDYYNFQSLNMPLDHPARDTQDSFYLSPTWVLRTQTSPMQIRALEQHSPPLAMISPGKVFRRDTIDATHSYCFHQIEGILVDEGVSFSDLRGVLIGFCQQFFGSDLKVRFRPDYFPFTEPSCEISIEYSEKKDGWLEILGAGMVNPVVLKNIGIDYRKYTGFAFGIGIERIAMLLHGINDIRLFFENDFRFLRQF